MKGMVFTEFLEMVEDKFGFATADKIIEDSDLASGGVYTSVGTYHHGEIVQLVSNLSKESEIKIEDLLQVFGKHLFSQFGKGYGHFFKDVTNAFQFLSGIENYIHVEVKKLYPDAELPTFDIKQIDENNFTMLYKSERGFADLAMGLIQGCIEHFGEDIRIEREDLDGSKEVRFTLVRNK